MTQNRYHTVAEYLDHLSDEHTPIIQELRNIFWSIEWIQESVKRDCLHYQYPNWMRVYINTKVQKYPVLWVSRGNKMVEMYPALAWLFDEVKAVVGKVVLLDLESVKNKWIQALADLCSEMPEEIGIR